MYRRRLVILSAPTRQICAWLSRTFFKRVFHTCIQKKFIEDKNFLVVEELLIGVHTGWVTWARDSLPTWKSCRPSYSQATPSRTLSHRYSNVLTEPGTVRQPGEAADHPPHRQLHPGHWATGTVMYELSLLGLSLHFLKRVNHNDPSCEIAVSMWARTFSVGGKLCLYCWSRGMYAHPQYLTFTHNID